MRIAFVHNVHNRYKTLLETIKAERELYPDSDIYVMYNLKTINFDLFEGIENIQFFYYTDTTHKLACANGCVLGFKKAIQKEYDVIMFSHDDVRVNKEYVDVLKSNVEMIATGEANVICRKPNNIYGDNYIMMEAFMIDGEYAKQVFSEATTISRENQLPRDVRESLSPEVFLSNIIDSENMIEKRYHHKIEDYNITLGETMGFYHKNIGIRGWKD